MTTFVFDKKKNVFIGKSNFLGPLKKFGLDSCMFNKIVAKSSNHKGLIFC